jgi:hypothetical protein
MRRTSVRLSRCSWSGASSSIFHRAACASPSVPYSVRSTVPSSSNSTRAQLNLGGSSHGSLQSSLTRVDDSPEMRQRAGREESSGQRCRSDAASNRHVSSGTTDPFAFHRTNRCRCSRSKRPRHGGHTWRNEPTNAGTRRRRLTYSECSLRTMLRRSGTRWKRTSRSSSRRRTTMVSVPAGFTAYTAPPCSVRKAPTSIKGA